MDANALIPGIRDQSRPTATRLAQLEALIPLFLEAFSEVHIQGWQALATVPKDPTEAAERRDASGLAISLWQWCGEAILTQQQDASQVSSPESRGEDKCPLECRAR